MGLSCGIVRPARIASSSPEIIEAGSVTGTMGKATAGKKEEVSFTPKENNGMILAVDSNCGSSSGEHIDLEYYRAKDLALRGRRTSKVQNVRVRYGDSKPQKKVAFATGPEESGSSPIDEARKRKRRESPPRPHDKHKKDKS